MSDQTFGWREDLTVAFGMVPSWVIRHPDLQGVDVRVFALIACQAFVDGVYEVPHEYMAEELNLSTSSIRRALRRLDGTALDIIPTTKPSGDRGPNKYRLYWTDPLSNVTPPVVTDDQTSGHVRPEGVVTGERASSQSGEMVTQTVGVSPVTQAERTVREWLDVMGYTATRSVVAKDLRKFRAHVNAGGAVPTRAEMLEIKRSGIRDIGGWARVDWLGDQTTLDADLWAGLE